MKISQVCELPTIDFVKLNLTNHGFYARILNEFAAVMQKCYNDCGNLTLDLSKVARVLVLDIKKVAELLMDCEPQNKTQIEQQEYYLKYAQAVLNALKDCEKEKYEKNSF